MNPRRTSPLAWIAVVVALPACGRTLLDDPLDDASAGSGGWTAVGAGAASGSVSTSTGVGASSGGGPTTSGIGGGPCQPSVETCNGLDDDCDGIADEGNPEGGQTCNSGGIGACGIGATACLDGSLACVPTAGTPEICDGIDNDCDGALDEGVACTKRVFITSDTYSSNLGGLAGADAICQAHAVDAGLGGLWTAWLSDSVTSAAQRLSHLAGPYVLIDGATIVAEDWAGLTSGQLLHPIDRTELGTLPPIGAHECSLDGKVSIAWTCTLDDGETACSAQQPFTGEACGDWSGAFDGWCRMGNATWSQFWTSYCNGDVCAGLAALYCIEQ